MDEKEKLRTPEEEFLDLPPTIEDFNSVHYNVFLESLSNLGLTSNRTYEVFKNFKATLRTLSPAENIEVMKHVDAAPGDASRILILKLETLSRCVTMINGQYLRFSDIMMSEWREMRGIRNNETPTEVEQQRYILKYKVPQFVIDQIFLKYQDLMEDQKQAMESLKKN